MAEPGSSEPRAAQGPVSRPFANAEFHKEAAVFCQRGNARKSAP